MKTMILPILCLILIAVSGCAMLDSFFGVNPDTGVANPDGSMSKGAEGLISGFGPWGAIAGGILGLFRWGYTELRARKLDKSMKAVVVGIKKGVDAAQGEGIDKAALYSAITAASEIYSNREFFAQLVEKIKAEYEKTSSS